MRNSLKESIALQKQQYSSRLLSGANTSKNGSRIGSKRGVSAENNRHGQNKYVNDLRKQQEEPMNLESIITQTTKGYSKPTAFVTNNYLQQSEQGSGIK